MLAEMVLQLQLLNVTAKLLLNPFANCRIRPSTSTSALVLLDRMQPTIAGVHIDAPGREDGGHPDRCPYRALPEQFTGVCIQSVEKATSGPEIYPSPHNQR